MLIPNGKRITEDGVVYSIHTFKDGETVLCQQHKCGDWFTLRRPRDAEVKVFEKYGEKVKKDLK